MESGANGIAKNEFAKFISLIDLSNNRFLLRETNEAASCDKRLDGLDHMTRLRSLALSNSGLRSLPLALGKMSNLEWLKIDRNELRSFRERIKDCHKLECIVARHNRLTSEGVGAADLAKLATLSVLDLSYNNLLFIPKDFERISSLTVLNLAHNSIRIIPKGLFVSLRNLLFLDLSKNCLETIPETLQKLKRLKRLSLNDNNTLSCERLGVLVYLRSLQSLYLRNTDRCLGGLPDLRHLAHLSDLDLSKNSMSTLPPHVYGLSRLKNLNLSDNCLTFLSSSELGRNDGWRVLQVLNLSRNRLSSLPACFSTTLKSCRRLYLNGNVLTFEGLPAGLDKITELEVLSLAGNQLKTLPESLGRCIKLKSLIISQNPIVAYPASLSTIKKQAQVLCPGEEAFGRRARRDNGLLDDERLSSTSPENGYSRTMGGHIKLSRRDSFFPDSVGRKEGLYCWFIDSFTPKSLPVPAILYSGECYMFLKSSKASEPTGSAMKHDIHLWIGKDAPVDKQGSMAVYAIQLRRAITRGEKSSAGQCRTWRHDQGCESDSFLQLFEQRHNVQWGCLTQSALYTVNTSDDENCTCPGCDGDVCRQMYVMKYVDGLACSSRIWTVRVPFSRDYMHRHGAVMIRLKVKSTQRAPMIVWFGKEVPTAKRAKIRLFVEQFCKLELADTVSEILDYREGEENRKFWILAFGQTRPDVMRSSPSRRTSFPAPGQIVCYIIRIRKNEVCIDQERFRQTARLSHNLVYVIDGWLDIFVWVGRRSNRLERAAAFKVATELKTLFPRPDDAAISVQMDGRETFLFRQLVTPQCVVNLQPLQSKTVKRSISVSTTPKSVLPRMELTQLWCAQREVCNRRCDESVKQVTAFELGSRCQPRVLDKKELGVFYSNSCYVYIVVGSSSPRVYFWQGRDIRTNKSWFLFNVHIKRKLHSLFGEQVEIVKIHQLQEPLEFVSLFDRSMVIYRPDNAAADVRFFQTSLHHPSWTRTVEIEQIEELCPLCIYIVYVKLSPHSGVVYVWQSDLTSDSDAFMAEKLAGSMFTDPNFPVQRISQGQEPDHFFWRSLGGVKSVWTVPSRQVRLFHCSNSNGYFEVTESQFPDKCQDCLADGDVSILDDGDETLFVWIGSSASQSTIVKAVRVAQLYAGRSSTEHFEVHVKRIRFVSKNKEPLEFRRCFFNWSDYKQPPVNLEKRLL